MEELIKKIIEAEQEAQQIVGKAEQMLNHIDDDVKAGIVEMTQQYNQRAKEQLEGATKEEQQMLENSLAELEKEYNDQLQMIESTYTTHSDEWINEMYQRIVG